MNILGGILLDLLNFIIECKFWPSQRNTGSEFIMSFFRLCMSMCDLLNVNVPLITSETSLRFEIDENKNDTNVTKAIG